MSENDDGTITLTAEEREQWPFKQYPLPGGATTNWPPGSEGYGNERVVCNVILRLQRDYQIGYGRMAQLCQQMMDAAMRQRVEDRRQASAAPLPAAGTGEKGNDDAL